MCPLDGMAIYGRHQVCKRHKNLWGVVMYQLQNAKPTQEEMVVEANKNIDKKLQLLRTADRHMAGMPRCKRHPLFDFAEVRKSLGKRTSEKHLEDTCPWEEEGHTMQQPTHITNHGRTAAALHHMPNTPNHGNH